MPAVHFCRGAVHACSSLSGPLAPSARLLATSARSLWPRLIAWIFTAACRGLGLGLGSGLDERVGVRVRAEVEAKVGDSALPRSPLSSASSCRPPRCAPTCL
eukprot:scaffold18654_cov66-Phaeocystis_antarctica.AAC.4